MAEPDRPVLHMDELSTIYGLVPDQGHQWQDQCRDQAVERDAECSEGCGQTVKACGLRRGHSAPGDAGRKSMRTPIGDAQTFQHFLADDGRENAADHGKRRGQRRIAADFRRDRHGDRRGHGFWRHGECNGAAAAEHMDDDDAADDRSYRSRGERQADAREIAADVMKIARQRHRERDGRRAEQEVDELRAAEIGRIGRACREDDKADDHDRE